MSIPPSGRQHVLEGHGYLAVVTESGATLRALSYDGRPLVVGHAEDEPCSAGRGQHLIPWPNRLRDGRYRFDGRDLQLPLSEPALDNAIHGLVRWAAWLPEEPTAADTLTMRCRLMAQVGYPWTLDLALTYRLSAGGLSVTLRATNMSSSTAPFAYGAHPYLTTGAERIDDDSLAFAAGTHLVVDERKLPTGVEPAQAPSGQLADLRLDDAYGELDRTDGLATVRLTRAGHGTELWADETFRWIQLFTADGVPGLERRGLAAEPMTAPPDAFSSGTDLIRLEPDETFTGTWGIRAV